MKRMGGMAITRVVMAVVLLVVGVLSAAPAQAAEPISLWHSYRGAEEAALQELINVWKAAYPDNPVVPLSVPYDAYANKLTSAIPRGNGPDLFIAAHERVGDWVQSGLLVSAPQNATDWPQAPFLEHTEDALTYKDIRYGLPLAFKSVALFANDDLLDGAAVPGDTAQLLALCEGMKTKRDDAPFCLVYEAGSFYHHAAWLYGFGGGIFSPDGQVRLDRPENDRSMAFVYEMTQKGYIPEEPNGALVSQLFNQGKAALVINGPWFLGEIDKSIRYSIHPLPMVAETGRAATPFLTVEGVLFPVGSKQPQAAAAFARFLTGPEGAAVRVTRGKQSVAWRAVYDDPAVAVSPEIREFRTLVSQTVPMPNDPKMRAVWEPAAQALRKALRGAAGPGEALRKAQQQFDIATRPAPPAKSPVLYLILFAVLAIVALAFIWRRMRARNIFSQVRGNGAAYGYIAPAALGMLLLVFVPFVVGTLVSLFAHREGEFTFVGLSNFISILTSSDYAIDDPLSFYFTLGVTVMWTAVNVFFHVSIGLALALLLRDPWMRLRGVYRVLLIIPWAVPNYITALVWKGMFHKQFGAINGFLEWLGLEPVSWFSHFWTSFAANVATNTWLGFPFMMVVTLGALQAIPRDLEEAAEVDGAGRFARFRHVTLPLLRPALLPAVILGSVWTFNMFNIIYLVSGGEPDGSTEILITEAYRWAFTRQEQYGYAAAYATLIFIVLLVYSWGTRKLVKEA